MLPLFQFWPLPPFPVPPCSALLDSAYEAMAQFFCERRGFSRQAALSSTGPVAALLAGVRAHLQQPKQQLLGRLVGLVASTGGGSNDGSKCLQHPAAWQFWLRLLCCLRALLGAGWEAFAKASRQRRWWSPDIMQLALLWHGFC